MSKVESNINLFPGCPDKRYEVFLMEFSKTGVLHSACQVAGINRKNIYNLRQSDEIFAELYQDALDMAADRLEAEAVRRGADGYLEPKFYKGDEIARVRKYSDNLLMFMLKGVRPDKFAERKQLSGPGGGPIPLTAFPAAPVDLADWHKQVKASEAAIKDANKDDVLDGITDI